MPEDSGGTPATIRHGPHPGVVSGDCKTRVTLPHPVLLSKLDERMRRKLPGVRNSTGTGEEFSKAPNNCEGWMVSFSLPGGQEVMYPMSKK